MRLLYLPILFKILFSCHSATNKGAMHNGSSVGTYAQCAWSYARLAPSRTISHQLLTIIITIAPRYAHLHVHFGTESYAQSALVDKRGMLCPFQSSVGNLLRVHCWLGRLPVEHCFCLLMAKSLPQILGFFFQKVFSPILSGNKGS